MTREEAIIQLKELKEHCFEMSKQGGIWVDDVIALDMAIKALEQEPILDKIRAEIESKMETIIGQYDSTTPMYDRPSHKIDRNKAREECIEIIDKYRQEG